MEPGSTKYDKFHIRSHNESGNYIATLGKHSSVTVTVTAQDLVETI